MDILLIPVFFSLCHLDVAIWVVTVSLTKIRILSFNSLLVNASHCLFGFGRCLPVRYFITVHVFLLQAATSYLFKYYLIYLGLKGK